MINLGNVSIIWFEKYWMKTAALWYLAIWCCKACLPQEVCWLFISAAELLWFFLPPTHHANVCICSEFHVDRHFSSTQRLVCVKHLDLPSSLFFVGQLNVTFTQCFYFRTSRQPTFVSFLFYRILQEAPPPSREQAKTKRWSSWCHNLTSHLLTRAPSLRSILHFLS